MENFKIALLISFGFLILLNSCAEDDGFQGTITLENCDESGCDAKNCAVELNSNTREVGCYLSSDEDIDWYAFRVMSDEVSTGTLSYDFSFSNATSTLTLAVELFKDGITNGGVITSGIGNGTFNPGQDRTGAVTFLEAGTYYLKVSRQSGSTESGEYEFSFF